MPCVDEHSGRRTGFRGARLSGSPADFGGVAGALNLIGGDTLYGRYWGCTEEIPFLHFELCYYQAIDAAIARLSKAAHGDLDSPVPPEVGDAVPDLANAMGGLFQQVSANLESVHRLAMFDPVTALPNRTHFRRAAERMLAEMPMGAEGALLFIDLDNFKLLNDTMGHDSGDQLLRQVAERLRRVVPDTAMQ